MDQDAPLIWKVPPGQAAAAFLIAAVAAVFVFYGHSASWVRVLCGVIVVLSVVGGIVATRAFLVVDDDGIGWRRVSAEVSIPWSDVERVGVDTERANRPVLTVYRHDRGPLVVPPTLVLPTRPTRTPDVVRQLHATAASITAYGEAHRR